MIIIAVIILIRLGFIACASRGRTGIYYYQTILSRVRARFTRSYTRARCTIALFLSLSLSMYVYMCVSGLIFIKSKCRTTASSTRSLLPRGTAINSPRVYDEAGRCRSRARDGNKIKKKRDERERAGMNNGSDDAKEQNNAGALGIYRGVTLTGAEQPGKCPRIEQTRPFSLPPAWRGLLTSLILGNYCHHRQPSDRNRAVTFSCYTCTIIIVSRNHTIAG